MGLESIIKYLVDVQYARFLLTPEPLVYTVASLPAFTYYLCIRVNLLILGSHIALYLPSLVVLIWIKELVASESGLAGSVWSPHN